jgi:hypothetical protein
VRQSSGDRPQHQASAPGWCIAETFPSPHGQRLQGLLRYAGELSNRAPGLLSAAGYGASHPYVICLGNIAAYDSIFNVARGLMDTQ